MDPSLIPIANFILNLLVIPLLMILNGINIKLTKLCSSLQSVTERIERLERQSDKK